MYTVLILSHGGPLTQQKTVNVHSSHLISLWLVDTTKDTVMYTVLILSHGGLLTQQKTVNVHSSHISGLVDTTKDTVMYSSHCISLGLVDTTKDTVMYTVLILSVDTTKDSKCIQFSSDLAVATKATQLSPYHTGHC